MQTKQLVQASANVIRITKIEKGDIYKRFSDDNNDDTKFGIVRNVYNDGENTVIEATEYSVSWRDMNVKNVVLRDKNDYILFPATLEDLQLEFKKVVSTKEYEINQKEKEIEEAKETIKITEKLISGEMQKELKTPEFKEMTQDKYIERKQLI
jgi:hypothetical protein